MRTAKPLAFSKNLQIIRRRWRGCGRITTGVNEAAEITALAKKMRRNISPSVAAPTRANGSGAKILKCLRTAPEVFNAAHSWVELSDLFPAALTGTEHPDKFIAGVCAAGS